MINWMQLLNPNMVANEALHMIIVAILFSVIFNFTIIIIIYVVVTIVILLFTEEGIGKLCFLC